MHKNLGQKNGQERVAGAAVQKGQILENTNTIKNTKTHSFVEGVFAFAALALLDCEHFDASEALPTVPTVAAANELYAGVFVGKGGNFLRCELMLLLPSM